MWDGDRKERDRAVWSDGEARRGYTVPAGIFAKISTVIFYVCIMHEWYIYVCKSCEADGRCTRIGVYHCSLIELGNRGIVCFLASAANEKHLFHSDPCCKKV